MNFSNRRISLHEAKEMDLVNYLSSLGHEPSKIRNNDFWYHSPLREEKTPSFKINRRLNRWYDHGIGKGGNLIDFGILYHQCSVGQFLQQLAGNAPLLTPVIQQAPLQEKTENSIKILADFPLKSHALLNYLHQRQIPIEIAERFCREVRYRISDNAYYGIGFKNDSDAWEIRNPYFKSSSSPKDISTFNTGADEVLVFEGFMDFLSYKTIQKGLTEPNQDIVVLNSVSFFEKARPFMEAHRSIHLYLDRDATGRAINERALSLSPKYQDKSKRYQHNKDLNEWLMSTSNTVRKRLGRKLR